MASQTDALLDLHLHPKQMSAFLSIATEILYGGAAGSGKSHLMRVAAITWCAEIPGLQVYLFRRIRDDLVKNHVEGPNGFRALLAGWVECGFCTIVEDEIRFWNGSKIYLCHCKDEKDRFKYQGAEIHVLLIDELTHFTDVIYRFLRNRVRMVGIKLAGEVPQDASRASSAAPTRAVSVTSSSRRRSSTASGRCKCAFRAEVRRWDAASSTSRRGSKTIRAWRPTTPAMTLGCTASAPKAWCERCATVTGTLSTARSSTISGKDRHVIKPFQIPKDWLRFRAGDWGSAKPFSFGWYAVASEPLIAGAWPAYPAWRAGSRTRNGTVSATDGEGKYVPNKGLKMTAERVGLAGSRQRMAPTRFHMACSILLHSLKTAARRSPSA